MATYRYSNWAIEDIVCGTKRLRLWFCAGAEAVLIAAAVVAWLRPEWIFGAEEHARLWVMAALFVFFAGPLGENLLRWKRRFEKLEQSLREMRVEVSAAGVVTPSRSLAREEIVRAEEVSWGLYVRTKNRYRWVLVPAKIEGYEGLKREIAEMGIPVMEAAAPPNWEESVGAVVFAGTMVCAALARDRGVLAVNLLVSALVATGGFVVVSANPENLPKMKWARLGIFLPVLMTASMLWRAWR